MNATDQKVAARLAGKTALITGASSGLGRQLALDLGPFKMNLVLASRSEPALRQVATGVEALGSAALVQATDITEADQCRELVAKTIAEFPSLDYLILCAGVSMWSRFEAVTDPGIFKRLIDVNYLGTVHCVYYSLPYLKRNRGTIVAISSVQGVLGIPNHSGYAAAKHALAGFLEVLEQELGGAVHILNVMPGWVRGTNLRANAFSEDGSPLGQGSDKPKKASVGIEECSSRIVKAMAENDKTLYIPSKLRLLPWLKLIAPGWLRSSIKRAVQRQE